MRIGSKPSGDGARAWLSVNPSRLHEPFGWSLCPATLVPEYLRTLVWPAVEELVGPTEPLERARVGRIDVAMDFHEVHHFSELVDGLVNLPRRYLRSKALFIGRDFERRQGLVLGGARNRVTLYSKSAEVQGIVPGIARFEVRSRGWQKGWAAKYGGINTVADISEDSVERVIRNRWRWSGMGSKVTSMRTIVDEVRATTWPEGEKTAVLGGIVRLAMDPNFELRGASGSRIRKHLDELQVAPSTRLFKTDEVIELRLDLESAREIVTQAA